MWPCTTKPYSTGIFDMLYKSQFQNIGPYDWFCGPGYVTLDHKTSYECQFFEIKIYTSAESWIN